MSSFFSRIHPVWLLLIGILIGALLMAGGFLLYHGLTNQQTEVPAGGEPSEFVEASEPAASTNSAKGGGSSLPAASTSSAEGAEASSAPEESGGSTAAFPAEWSSGTVYTGGQEVTHNKRVYRARWWTQGEEPDFADKEGVWEYVGETTPLIIPDTSSEEDLSMQPENKVIPPDGFKVVAYYPSWEPQSLNKARFDTLTHVIYAFAIPTAEGGLRPLENPETARQLVQKAHQAGAKALIAIGGWSYNDVPLEATFVSATADSAKRKGFADAIIALMEEYGFDGVDMDWEHPRVDGNTSAQYEALMLDLSERLHKNGKLLTSAVLSGATPDGSVYYDAAAHSDKVIAAVDWLNVMAYDGGDGDRHSSYEFAVNCGLYWSKTRKAGAEKVVLGVPFYGRPSWAAYEDILAANPNADQTDISTINGMEAHYNGVATIRKKTRYALENLGGVMIWEITQDTADTSKSLLSAIKAEIAAGK